MCFCTPMHEHRAMKSKRPACKTPATGKPVRCPHGTVSRDTSDSHAVVASVGSAVSVSEFMFQLESDPPLAPLSALVRDRVVGPVRGRGEGPGSSWNLQDPRLSTSARSRVPQHRNPTSLMLGVSPMPERISKVAGYPSVVLGTMSCSCTLTRHPSKAC